VAGVKFVNLEKIFWSSIAKIITTTTMADKDKKRKRDSAREERPHKRVALTSTIKVIHLPKESIGPVIASTPGFSIPKNITFKAYQNHAKSRGDDRDGDSELLLHSSTHPRLDYKGQEESSGNGEKLLKHYAAVFDPAAGKLTVTEVPHVTIRSTLRPSQEELDEANERAEKKTMTSLRQTLGMEFGTKKAKKAIASLTENAITPHKGANGASAAGVRQDALTEAMLDNLATTTASIPTREDKQATIDSAHPRPTPNLDAIRPSEAYPLKDLVSDEDLSKLAVKDWQDTLAAGEKIQTTMRYVAFRLDALNGKTKMLKVMKYLYTLLNFYIALKPLRTGGKKLPTREDLKKATGADGAILDGIRRNFAVGRSVYLRP
jgi:DNA-directed RNA polymerase I subunit RPA49